MTSPPHNEAVEWWLGVAILLAKQGVGIVCVLVELVLGVTGAGLQATAPTVVASEDCLGARARRLAGRIARVFVLLLLVRQSSTLRHPIVTCSLFRECKLVGRRPRFRR